MRYYAEPLTATETRVKTGNGQVLGKVQEMTAAKLFVAMVDNHDVVGISYTVVGNYATHEEAAEAVAAAHMGMGGRIPGKVHLNTRPES